MTNTQVLDPARLPFTFADALNSGDADALLALFNPGATMRTLDGQILSGTQELREEVLRTIAAESRLTNKPRFCLTGMTRR